MQIISLIKKHKTLSVIISLAFIARLGLLAYGLSMGNAYFFSFDDAYGYLAPAEMILNGQGFSADFNGVIYPETARTPGYPAIIASSLLLFKSILPLILLQIIVGSLILPLLAYRIVLLWWGNARVATASALATAFEPLTLLTSTLLLTETLFIAFLLGGILYLSRSKSLTSLAIAGVLFGIATLIKPVGLYLIPIIGVFILIHELFKQSTLRKAVAGLIIFFVASGAIYTPWMIRNYYQASLFSLSSFSGIVPYYFTGSSILALATGSSFADARQDLRMRARAAGIQELRDPRNVPYYRNEAKRIIRDHPKEFVSLISLAALHFFTHDGYLDALFQIGMVSEIPKSSPNITLLTRGDFGAILEILKQFLTLPWFVFVVIRALWGGILILAILGAIVLLKKLREYLPETILAILLVLAFAMTSSVVGLSVTGRHRIPVNFILIAFAMFGLHYATLRIAGFSFFRRYTSYSSNS